MKNTSGIAILVNVNSNYADIAEIFVELFDKNWSDCPYPVFFLTDKKFNNTSKFKVLVCSDELSLPGKVYLANHLLGFEYYICLLGDAFITEKVNSNLIDEFVTQIKTNGIDYCKIMVSRPKLNHSMIELIDKMDTYAVSFLAYIANRKFIEKEFIENISDFDFENKYLNPNMRYELRNIARLNHNIFNLTHGVIKGKWITSSYRKIQKYSYRITQSVRPKLNLFEEVKLNMVDSSYRILSLKNRAKIKKLLNKIGFKFLTNY